MRGVRQGVLWAGCVMVAGLVLWQSAASAGASEPVLARSKPHGRTQWIKSKWPDSTMFGNSVSGGGDVNGDGYDDLLIGAPFHAIGTFGMVFLFKGAQGQAENGFGQEFQDNSERSAFAHFGSRVEVSGDYNCDGFADLVVTAPSRRVVDGGAELGEVLIYAGSAEGVGYTPAVRLVPSLGYKNFGNLVAAGDVNADGCDELFVGSVQSDGDGSMVSVYYGTSAGLMTSPSAVFSSPATDPFGQFVAIATGGDLNGDGYEDFAFARPLAEDYTGVVEVYYGGDGALAAFPARVFKGLKTPGEFGVSDTRFGAALSIAGDVNGDGFDDLVIGAPRQVFQVYLFPGSADGIGEAPTQTLEVGKMFSPLGMPFDSLTSGTDLNGDGFADLVVGSVSYQFPNGGLGVVLGGENGFETELADLISGINGGNLGDVISDAGDVDGDGLGDVVVGAHGQNAVLVYYGLASLGVDQTLPNQPTEGEDADPPVLAPEPETPEAEPAPEPRACGCADVSGPRMGWVALLVLAGLRRRRALV